MKYPSIKLSMLQRQLIPLAFATLLFTVPAFAADKGIARQQLEGGIVYGLTAALKGEINVQDGQIVQSNFDDYPILKLKDTPEINVHLMENHEAPGGL